MVYLARKNDVVIVHTNEQAMLEMDGLAPEMTVSNQEWEAAESRAQIIDGAIFLGKTNAEKQKELDEAELRGLKAEIASRDYRALKAYKLGVDLESVYPGESAWYQTRLDRVHELKAALDNT
jgi:hypothetical protein